MRFPSLKLLLLVALLVVGLAVLQAQTRALSFVRYWAPPTNAVLPVVGLRMGRVSSSWGAPREGGKRAHEGVDLAAPRNTPVIAVTDGELIRTGINPLGGNCVWALGADASLYYYAHLDHWAAGLTPGQALHAGDVLGYVGTTGNAAGTPPHLHFGIYPLANHLRAVDPVPLLHQWKAGTVAALPP